MFYVLVVPVGIIFGFLICYLFFRLRQVSRERTSKNVIVEAKSEAERILKSADITAREDLYKRKERIEKETQETRHELRQLEKRLSKREDNLEVTRRISESVDVPVVASGGAGCLAHVAEVLHKGKADAVLAASIFHFGEYSVADVKAFLEQDGIPVRTI